MGPQTTCLGAKKNEFWLPNKTDGHKLLASTDMHSYGNATISLGEAPGTSIHIARRVNEYDGRYTRLCPDTSSHENKQGNIGKQLQINTAHRIHCMDCNTKDPYKTTDWMMPEAKVESSESVTPTIAPKHTFPGWQVR